jgi:hypothetical protein
LVEGFINECAKIKTACSKTAGTIQQNKGPVFMGKKGCAAHGQNAYLIYKSLLQMRLFKSPPFPQSGVIFAP